MKSTDATVQIARIEARKTILSAVIGGLVTLATVLAGHWFANRGPAQPAGGTTSAAVDASPVLAAPEIHFDSRHIDWPLERCVEQAKGSLERSALTGLVVKEYLAWGYQQRTTGLIWCNTDDDRVLFIAAGPDAEACARVVKELTRNF